MLGLSTRWFQWPPVGRPHSAPCTHRSGSLFVPELRCLQEPRPVNAHKVEEGHIDGCIRRRLLGTSSYAANGKPLTVWPHYLLFGVL